MKVSLPKKKIIEKPKQTVKRTIIKKPPVALKKQASVKKPAKQPVAFKKQPQVKNPIDPLAQAMLKRTGAAFNARVKCISYVKGVQPHVEIQPKKVLDKIVWQYWDKGIAHAPPQVKTCFKSVEKYIPEGYQLIRLDNTNLNEYIDIPPFIKGKKISPAHFADFIRVLLLHQYGGIWMDATIYLTGPIPKLILDAPFFVFKYGDSNWAMFSNWFMRSERGNYLTALLLSAISNYWRANLTAHNYFFFHYLFECILMSNEHAREQYDKSPRLSSPVAQALQHQLWKPFNQLKWVEITGLTSIHKLTWKCKVYPGTLLNQLITGAI